MLIRLITHTIVLGIARVLSLSVAVLSRLWLGGEKPWSESRLTLSSKLF